MSVSTMGSTKVPVLIVTLTFLNLGSALRCGKINDFDNNDFFSCPRNFDDPKAIFCCGNSCCKSPIEAANYDNIGKSHPKSNRLESETEPEVDLPKLSDSIAEKRSVVNGLANIVGIVIGVMLFVLVLCVLCCCCCPFCLIAKRRKEGRVLRRGNDVAEATQMNTGQDQYPGQQGYAIQQGYPAQQGYLLQQGYPPQQGYAAHQGYATQQSYLPPQSAGYPTPIQYPGYVPHSNQQYQPYSHPVQPAFPAQQFDPSYPAPNMPSYPPPYSGQISVPVQQPQVHTEVYQSQPAFNPNF